MNVPDTLGRDPAGGREPSASATAAGSGIAGSVKSFGPSTAPAISLPKGGGAIRGIGEKFAANPVTGTGSMSVPIATSPGRSGFGPQLSLSYDSGSGNGPFGFGWSLALPSITRMTDKGLPQYIDASESDVFIMSGAEDLVPGLDPDDDITAPGHTIRRYRPRIEGLFARIERWSNDADPTDIHWRSISKENVLTLYGKDAGSRIFDPSDRRRIFSWLICETRDDKGSAILYEYKREDGAGVVHSRASERNRGDPDDTSRTANRYLKRIRYGNRGPLLNDTGRRPQFLADLPASQVQDAAWMFEVVFDYGEHDAHAPTPDDAGLWDYRGDPFSSYRPGFEVRTTRLCQRVLMFHHIPDVETGEKGYEGLVRSTDFTYSGEEDPTSAHNPVYTFLNAVTQSGYRPKDGGYLKRSLPSVEFDYTQPVVQDTVEEVDSGSLENVPIGVDGASYQWTDLHGEGIPGILTEQAEAWFYKRNVSPISKRAVEFAPLERVTVKPNLVLAGGQTQFMDLAGDGQPDLVMLDGPTPGLYEHDADEGWQPFRPFTSRLNRDTRDPNLKFVDLDGDGHADVLITEDDAFAWHPSLAEAGFGPALRVAQALDEEKGPRLVFADGTESIYLADLSGDGLTDLARIRNGEICYWPNLGYGRFGAKVTMDHAPQFDNPDQFDQKRIRLADIDGSGTTDIIYLHRDGVRLYFNQAGNGWSEPQQLKVFPRVTEFVSIVPTDLLGNGTACLVWSSPLPGDARRPMRYVNLMGGHKPHLLVKTTNNLGAETVVQYAPSTKFYLQDKRDGRPWISRLPFPVHVVERVETHDRISRNRFITRYAYHHGYFDGEEREFRGFAMLEQWDTEELAALTGDGTLPEATNLEAASHVPPVHTKTWFHTGIYVGRDHVSDYFAGAGSGQGEYYRELALRGDEGDPAAGALLLPDTVLPPGLSLQEEREACRALKGMMLRQEVYADDAPPGSTAALIERAGTPYTVAEHNFTIQRVQPRAGNRHAVFFAHPREAITNHYERDPADPRVQHALTLEVDPFGNVLKEVAIGYRRHAPDASLPTDEDREIQTRTLVTYTQNRVTQEPLTGAIDNASDYRTPLPCETRTYELTGFKPAEGARHFSFNEWEIDDFALVKSAEEIPYQALPDLTKRQKRLIEHLRTLYRRNDLTDRLPLGAVESLALPCESYKLALTPDLARRVFIDSEKMTESALNVALADEGGYVHSEGDANWWIPAGQAFFHPDADVTSPALTAAEELLEARGHFFLPRKFADPFHQSTTVAYTHDLLVSETQDSLGNTVVALNDHRVLQPHSVIDPNLNRADVEFDALGMVVGTAVKGKDDSAGDNLIGFDPDLTQGQIDEFYDVEDPHVPAPDLLKGATTRIVYDLGRFHQSRQDHPNDPTKWLPVYSSTLAREVHVSDLRPDQGLRIQIGFSYSDGFGREIQKKIQAEPGRLVPGGPIVSPRWVGSGWTIFNNKGKPVREFEPFFSQLADGGHRFEFGVQVGVSPILFYDPVDRVVATLHPNHTYEKVVFDPWRQVTCDVNDTVLGDPRTDADIGGYTAVYFAGLPASPPAHPWQTWHEQRQGEARGSPDRLAADNTAAHADTPTTAHFDTLGRPFLTQADNGPDPAQPGKHLLFATRVELDIEGNQRAVRDAIEQAGDKKGRIVMRYAYDMLGNRIYQLSMDAGARWMLNDVVGKPIYTWDSRDHQLRTAYDALRRPTDTFLREGIAAEIVVGRSIYGESRPNPEASNLRGKLVQLFDQAGVVTSDDYDFKGNLLRSQRQFARSYTTTLDWSGAVAREVEMYTSDTRYDALNRPTQLIAPHSDQPGATVNVIQPIYNEANLLDQVHAWLNQSVEPASWLDPASATLHAVTNIDYDAKGQRQRIDYGNRALTTYDYDPLTFRLVHLLTRRDAPAFPGDCPKPPPVDWPGCEVQSLHYTYDPAGNITHIRDDAQQTIYFKNQRIEPSADYKYDATYRLIEATGREHLGQAGGSPIPHSHNDVPRVGIWTGPGNGFQPGDGKAMGSYCESYVYDAVGNISGMLHRLSCPDVPSWTRSYSYGETSLIEDGTGGLPLKTNNRLSSTTVGNGRPVTERYAYDAHGNGIRMPHLGGTYPARNMHWDYRDQLRQTDMGGGGTAYYVYDASGQRVRKVWEKSPGVTEERLYLGGFEIFRRHLGPIGSNTATLVRETLHLTDDKQRIALVETRALDTAGNDPAPRLLIRYQFSNHLGSASLELDEHAQIISYEEYTPYGSTSYQAVRSQTETPKRYRYTNKERDEESGLYYLGARYYSPWLGRWTSSDPAGLADGPNTFAYVRNNPVRWLDPAGTEGVTREWLDNPQFRGAVQDWVEHPSKEPDKLRGSWNELSRGRITWEQFHAQTGLPGPFASQPAVIGLPNQNALRHSPSELFERQKAAAGSGIGGAWAVSSWAGAHLEVQTAAGEFFANLGNVGALVAAGAGGPRNIPAETETQHGSPLRPRSIASHRPDTLSERGTIDPGHIPTLNTATPVSAGSSANQYGRPRNPGETPQEYGDYMHDAPFRAYIERNFPGQAYGANTGPGITGPDLHTPPVGLNARAGEMKPIWQREYAHEAQIRNWKAKSEFQGLTSENVFRLYYDAEGRIFGGFKQPEWSGLLKGRH